MSEENNDALDANAAADEGAVATAEPAAAPKSDAAPKIDYKVVSDQMREHCIRALTVDIPRSVFDERLVQSFGDLKKNVSLPGFRRGKAPEGLLRRRFGKEMEQETVQRIAEIVYDQLSEALDIKMASPAEMEDYNLEEKDAFQVDYVVEIIPEVEPKNYKGVEVEATYAEPDEPPMDRYIEQMSERWGTFEEKDGPLEDGDAARADVEVHDESSKRIGDLCQTDKTLHPLKDRLPEAVVAELLGKSKGTEIEVAVDYERTGAGGKVVSSKDTYKVALLAVERFVPATIDDAFIQENFQLEGGLEEYKKNLIARWEKDRDSEKRSVALRALYDKFLESNDFQVPRSLVGRQANSLLQEEARRLAMYGIDMSKMIRQDKAYLDSLREQAERMVRVGFLVSAIAKAEGIEATEEDVEKEIAKRAEEAGRKPLAIRAQLERQGELDSLQEDLKLDATANFLIENNKISYVAPKEEAEASAEEGEGADEDAASEE